MKTFFALMTEEFFTRIILGDVATVKTLGIITAENPQGRKLVKTGNEKKNKELEEILQKKGFDPVQMKGKFAGKQENPFLVINISREFLADLAKKFNQESVIFGEKKQDKFQFSYIENGRTSRKGVLGVDHPENPLDRDCYFTLSGKKFNIHF